MPKTMNFDVLCLSRTSVRGKVVELPLLCNDRCLGQAVLSRKGAPIAVYRQSSTSLLCVVQTVHVELPQMQFFDSRRNSSCGAEASLGLQTARKPSTLHGCSVQQFFRSELITQVMGSCNKVSVTLLHCHVVVTIHIAH